MGGPLGSPVLLAQLTVCCVCVAQCTEPELSFAVPGRSPISHVHTSPNIGGKGGRGAGGRGVAQAHARPCMRMFSLRCHFVIVASGGVCMCACMCVCVCACADGGEGEGQMLAVNSYDNVIRVYHRGSLLESQRMKVAILH